MKLIFKLLLPMLLVSCGSLIKSETEFLASGGGSQKYCSSVDAKILKYNLEKHMHKCYVDKPRLYMNGAQISADMYLHKKEFEGGTQFNFLIGEYYNAVIFIYDKPNSDCKSELRVVTNLKRSSDDSRVFKQYKDLSEGVAPSCF